MGKLDDCVAKYEKEFKKLGITYKPAVLRNVAKACGPSIYKRDAATVSAKDPKELARVRKSFLIGKLGLKDTPKLDEGIQEVIANFGKGNRNKYRAMFYYMLAARFRKLSMFK